MWKWCSHQISHKKGTAIIITMIIVSILITYSFVLTSNSLSNSKDTNQNISNMGALYLAESGLDTFLLRLQADPENAIILPLSVASHPGVGEGWQGITLSDGIHYFVSPMMYLPKERLVSTGVAIPELAAEDALAALPHAEDGTGISAADVAPGNRRIYANSVGSFFIRVAYFQPNGPDGIAGNGDDAFVPWAGDTNIPALAFDPTKFAIQVSAVVHLFPRGETQVSEMEGFLDLNNNGVYNNGVDEVVDISGVGRNVANYRKVRYDAVRIVEGSLRSNSEPDITKLLAGALINVGVPPSGTPKLIEFSNPGSKTIIKGQVVSNTSIKSGSTINLTSGFDTVFQSSANYLDENGFPVFKYGWQSTLLATLDGGGSPIVWSDLDIVNPVDGTRLFKAPYGPTGGAGEIQDSSIPKKDIPSEYLEILRPSLDSTSAVDPDEIDKGLVTAGSDSQLFNITQYVAAAAGTKVVNPVTGVTTTVAGKYFNNMGVQVTTGTMPGRKTPADAIADENNGDIIWSDNPAIVAFQGPAGWVFKDEAIFAKMMSLKGELQGIVVVNYINDRDLKNTTAYTTPPSPTSTTALGLLNATTNLLGKIKVKGTLVFRFQPSFVPDSKIMIGAELLVNPATFPTYPTTQGVNGGTPREQYLYDTRGKMIPPNDPLFFNYDGSAPSGYPDTPAKRLTFFDAAQGVVTGTPTVFAEQIDITEYDDPSKPPGTKFKRLGDGTEFPDYPAVIFNQSTVDIHGTANICGVVFGPANAEIENKGEGSPATPLYHYFCGAIVAGNGIKIKNEAAAATALYSGIQWQSQVFIYAPSHLNSLAIESEFIPGAFSSWSFLSTSIRK